MKNEVNHQIEAYLQSLPESKYNEMKVLHQLILEIQPGCKLWFLDGKNDKGEVIANPNIGYGEHTIHYAGGRTRAFYQIGLSANTTGISIYIMGIADKKILAQLFAKEIGKASITGYCIKFKSLNDVNMNIVEAVIRFGFEQNK